VITLFFLNDGPAKSGHHILENVIFISLISTKELGEIHGSLSCLPAENSRIVGGEDATPRTWRWIVKFNRIGCSGTIVHPNFVVTAAHCCAMSSMEMYEFSANKLGVIELEKILIFGRHFDF